jgi:hypothetical protein
VTGREVEAIWTDTARRLDRPAEPVVDGQLAAFDVAEVATRPVQLDLFHE